MKLMYCKLALAEPEEQRDTGETGLFPKPRKMSVARIFSLVWEVGGEAGATMRTTCS